MVGDIFSLLKSGNSLHFTHVSQYDSWHTQSYSYMPLITNDIRRKSKYTMNHPRTHSDFRSRNSSISIAGEILMTNNRVVFSWANHFRTLLSNMFYVLWLIFHILWLVKHDHLTEYILVLVYCHCHDNNRLGTFRIVFFYASRFYYPSYVFDNFSRITIHGHSSNKSAQKHKYDE